MHDQPGVTRDLREAPARIGDLRFKIIDTAGLDDVIEDEMSEKMWQKTELALSRCDLVFFVIDAREGVTPLDYHYAELVRKSGKTSITLANKAEGGNIISAVGEASALGLGEVVAISAEHGEGMNDLFYALDPYIYPEHETPSAGVSNALQLAIVGRPNVGKSTLINYILQEERLITADFPGVTRDAIAVDWEYKGQAIRLVDTAGMRRKSNITSSLEKMSVQDALRAVDYAQVVILVLDHENPLAKQEAVIANRVIEEGRILVIAINKWDLVKDRKAYMKELEYQLDLVLPQVKGIPCVPISAKTGHNVEHLLDISMEMFDYWNKRVPTSQLNRWLEETISYHPPPLAGRSRIKIKYMTQAKTRPPTFAIFCSKAKDLPDTYVRYLQNSLRETFNMPGVPIRINVKGGENPYDKKKS